MGNDTKQQGHDVGTSKPVGQPSDGSNKNEPTPERAHEEKDKQERR